MISGAVLAIGILGCGDDDGSNELASFFRCDVVVADADCDKSKQPIVFIHGTFGSATEISTPAQLFGSNGYCQDRFVAVEYDSLGDSPQAQLEALVDDVLARTGFNQVVLAGHSQGTRHSCDYLESHSDKVAHYLNLSGGCDGLGVPSLSLSSQNDLGVPVDGVRMPGPIHPAPTSTQQQVTLEREDHVAVAGSKNAFVAMWRYLYGEDPEYTTIQCGQDPVVLDGKAVTLGDNVIRANATIDVFEVDQLDHPWERGTPTTTIQADADGHFRVELRRGVRYEFRQWDADGTLLGYVYYAPFKRSNYLLRLLSESQNPIVRSAVEPSGLRASRAPKRVWSSPVKGWARVSFSLKSTRKARSCRRRVWRRNCLAVVSVCCQTPRILPEVSSTRPRTSGTSGAREKLSTCWSSPPWKTSKSSRPRSVTGAPFLRVTSTWELHQG